jgi:hypothetical protein
MRDDGDFFKSVHDSRRVAVVQLDISLSIFLTKEFD